MALAVHLTAEELGYPSHAVPEHSPIPHASRHQHSCHQRHTRDTSDISLTDSKAGKSGCLRCTGTATPGGYVKSKVLGPLPRSKNQHAGKATETYLKLRNWEGKVSVFGPDMAAGILEVFHWCVLRVLAQKRERCDQDENLPGCDSVKSCHNLLLLKGQATGPAGLGVQHRAGRRGEEGSPEVQGSQEAMRHSR